MSGKSAKARREKMLSRSGLRHRGWSPAMIRDLLGVEDATAQNPHYRNAAPMRLYRLSRVAAAERRPDFERLRDAAASRSATARGSAARRGDALTTWAREVAIHWVKAPATHEEAIEAGIRSWELRTGNTADQPDRATRERWALNYLRHECLTYDHAVDHTVGKPAVDKAYGIIRGRCEKMIEEPFPKLAT